MGDSLASQPLPPLITSCEGGSRDYRWVCGVLGSSNTRWWSGSARLSKVGTIAMGEEWSGQSGDTTLVTKGDGIVCMCKQWHKCIIL